MDATAIILLLMFLVPFVVAVATDIVIDWLVVEAERPRPMLICIENILAVVAFYALVVPVVELGLRGASGVFAMALPKGVILVASLVLTGRIRNPNLRVRTVSVLLKFASFVILFELIMWLASLD